MPISEREQDGNGQMSSTVAAIKPKQLGVNPKDAVGASKVPMGYFPPAALLYASLGLWNGDIKYDKYNWREGGKVLASIYIDAVERHLGLWKSGEELDKRSGVPHLGHAMAGLAILVDALEGDYLVDDRPQNQYDFGALLDKWNAQGPGLVNAWRKERLERMAAQG